MLEDREHSLREILGFLFDADPEKMPIEPSSFEDVGVSDCYN